MNKNNAMTKNDLKKLRARLPKNYRELIRNSLKANRTYSNTYISAVLNGNVKVNADIVEAAILVAEQYENELSKLSRAARGEEKLDKLKFNLQN